MTDRVVIVNLVDAIKAINPNAQVNILDNDINKISWLNDTVTIAKEDILAKQAELQTACDNAKYQRDRVEAYPSIGDQLDDLYHNGIDGWKTTIKAVKDKYPKG